MAATAPPEVDPGSILRQARARLGETLDEAAHGTRISRRHLEALEAGAPPEVFPSPVYARLFLRTYARYLRLDEGSLMEAFSAPSRTSAHRVAERARPGALAGRRTASRRRPVPRVRTSGSAKVVRAPARTGPDVRDNGKGLATVTWLTGDPAREAGEGQPVRPGSNGSRVPPRPQAMPASEAAARRRAGAALLAIGVAAAVLVPTAWLVRGGREPALADPAKGPAAAVRPKPNPLPELPGGGQVIFPGHRVVAYYGAPISERLGVLGVGTPDQMAAKLLEQTAAYDSAGLPALPAMELIATVASHSAGDDGTYRFRLDPGVVDEYLQAARRAHALFIIDVQPGRAHFLPEVKVYEKWLKEPDVSLALDPEWRVSPTGVPGKELGSVGAAEVNQVVEWLSGIVEQNKLPQKMLVIHQFTPSMITDRSSVQSPPGVAVVFDADGVGGRAVKMQKYRFLTENTKDYFQGFKLFYQTDTDLLTPKMVVKLKPRPDLVIYQ